MRLIFALLLLANLAFFAWWYWLERPAAPPVAADPGVPVLRLYGELDQDQRAALTGRQPAVEGGPAEAAGLPPAEDAPGIQEVLKAETRPAAQAVCASLGPFHAPEQAASAATRMRRLGYAPRLRSTGGQLRSGYWVYLPPYPSRDAAERVAGQLRARGVEDLYIVGGAENRNAISLGLFSTPERADRRAAQIGRLGFTPQIAERFRDATVYWLDYREAPDEPLDPAELELAGLDSVPERVEVPCEAPPPGDGEGR